MDTDQLYRRYEHISYTIQHKAYLHQMEGRTKPLKFFNPCAKGLVFTEAMANISNGMPEVTGVVFPKALLTPCSCGCHNNLTDHDLFTWFTEVK